MKTPQILLISLLLSPVFSLAQYGPEIQTSRAALCWSFCTNAFIESEAIRMGKQAVNLSESYLIQKILEEKSASFLRMKGNMQFGPGGNIADGLALYQKYGALPQSPSSDQQEKLANLPELEAILTGMLTGLIGIQDINKNGHWKNAVQKILDLYLGQHSTEQAMKFAREKIGLDARDYIQLTSWTHLPYFEKSILQQPDNWALNHSLNLPLETFMAAIDSALNRGYTILWSGDVSESFFSWEDGLAYVPNKDISEMTINEKEELFVAPLPEKEVGEVDRQEAYDNFQTQSDFIMQLVGKVEDQSSRRWYLFKNACEIDAEENFLYISQDYLKLKTVSILLHQTALAEEILAKLK